MTSPTGATNTPGWSLTRQARGGGLRAFPWCAVSRWNYRVSGLSASGRIHALDKAFSALALDLISSDRSIFPYLRPLERAYSQPAIVSSAHGKHGEPTFMRGKCLDRKSAEAMTPFHLCTVILLMYIQIKHLVLSFLYQECRSAFPQVWGIVAGETSFSI